MEQQQQLVSAIEKALQPIHTELAQLSNNVRELQKDVRLLKSAVSIKQVFAYHEDHLFCYKVERLCWYMRQIVSSSDIKDEGERIAAHKEIDRFISRGDLLLTMYNNKCQYRSEASSADKEYTAQCMITFEQDEEKLRDDMMAFGRETLHQDLSTVEYDVTLLNHN